MMAMERHGAAPSVDGAARRSTIAIEQLRGNEARTDRDENRTPRIALRFLGQTAARRLRRAHDLPLTALHGVGQPRVAGLERVLDLSGAGVGTDAEILESLEHPRIVTRLVASRTAQDRAHLRVGVLLFEIGRASRRDSA